MLNDMLDLQMKYARKNPVKTVDLEENNSFRLRVAHVLRGRSLKEFVAEVGLGPQQSLSMSAAEITAFVDEIERQQADSPYAPSAWKPKTFLPSHFTLED